MGSTYTKITAILLLLVYQAKGQENIDISLENKVREANKLKTGNWQDVFSNFFQAAVKDLTGDKKSFDFKSTLFALKVKADPSLNVDTNYVRHAFDRNFQFNIGLKLDREYRYKSFAAGFTWAIINKRDSSIINLVGTWADSVFNIFADQIFNALNDYQSEATRDDFIKVQVLTNQMLNKGKFEVKEFPEDFRKKLNKHVQSQFYKVDSVFKREILKTRKKPLLTFSLNSEFKKGPNTFDGGNAEIIFLQGLTNTGRSLDLDLRGNLNVIDTLIMNKRYRTEFQCSGGANFGIIENPITHVAVVEFKPHIEYKRILRGLYPLEKEGLFSANADVRIRISNNIFIPLTLKYDLENDDFLGFLNVSINWDAFKKAESVKK